jgi:hypothetical protein
MNCALLDFGCHAANVASDMWRGFSPASKLLIIVGLLSIVGGSLWGVAKALHRLGGWPAVLGAGAVLAGLVLAVLPKKPEPFTGEHVPPRAPDSEFSFGVDRVRPKKKRETVGDIFAKWRR